MRAHFAFAFILAATQLVAAEPDKLTVSVRALTPARLENSSNMQMEDNNDPSLPNILNLLPQYQGTRGFRPDAEEQASANGATTRFILALPLRPIILDAVVTIDGKSFKSVRERRIDRLLEEIKKPLPKQPALKESDSQQPAPKDDAELTEEADEDTADDKAQEEENANQSSVEPMSIPSTAIEARLRRYATVTGREPTRDEVRWLLSDWVDGPTLLLLDENFQRLRANQRPVFDVLDRDIDGSVSVKELEDAAKTLMSCDVNQNEIVEYAEIADAVDDPRRKKTGGSIPQLLPLLDSQFVIKTYKRLARRYLSKDALQHIDTNADGQLDESEIEQLRKKEADFTVTVAFHSSDPSKSTVNVARKESAGKAKVRASSVTIPVDGVLLEFSAVQSQANNGSDQISIGAINDGFPVLPAVDPNDDGRLTIRELRNAVKHVRSFDKDENGLSVSEIPTTIRVSIGLGPIVHQHLADIRSVHPPAKPSKTTAPEWFVQMDKNKDGDLSPREFLFGEDQFKKLDKDMDGLISGEEAGNLKAEKK